MNIAVLSDIHGNATALKAALDDAKQFSIDNYILLGDYFDAGPEPVETYNILRELSCVAIKGNHDNDLILYNDGYLSEWNNCCLFNSILWTHRKLSKDMLQYLASLPEQITTYLAEDILARVAHGSPDNISEAIMPQVNPGRLNDLLFRINESVLICGHTHNPFSTKIKNKYYINSGSVGQPHNIHAEYAIIVLDGESIKTIHRKVPYDINKVKKVFIESGLLEEGGICAKMNLLSLETGKVYYFAFKDYARKYAINAGYNKDIPNEIWIEASKTWDWIV